MTAPTAGGAEPTLVGEGIVRRHGGLVAVDHVDVRVDAGTVIGLVGPNGAGKSTLLDCLAGTQPLDAGRVLLEGRDVSREPADARSRRGLVRTFQRSSVFASLTVGENLRIGAENRGRRGLVRGIVGLPDPGTTDAFRSVHTVAHRLGLTPILDRPASTLPTGTLRLVELGRALCSDPTVLLLDEPASGLDESETDQMRDVLLALRGEGIAIAVVEHDLELVRELADTLLVMAAGRVVASGATAEVLARADVRATLTGAPA
jgi:branched-chain amino acid transport system ATP-binding protein